MALLYPGAEFTVFLLFLVEMTCLLDAVLAPVVAILPGLDLLVITVFRAELPNLRDP